MSFSEHPFPSGDKRRSPTLDDVPKLPTRVGETHFPKRTANPGSLPAIYPGGQGHLDIVEHMAKLVTDEHRDSRFIEKSGSNTFRNAVRWLRRLVDRGAEQSPGERRQIEMRPLAMELMGGC